ncbi:transglycosylase domain-containing protein [Candidatus Gracilibacteria bacterium]|nr:transglycosylase domain-containing protein [Candidatus Gracilibacteria bacterium]
MQSVRGAFRKCILSKHTLWFRRKFSRSHTKQWTWKRKILWGAGGIFGGIFLYGLFFLPSVDDAEQFSFAESTIIYDREALNPEEDPNDHILYVIHGDENREYVPLEEIPKHMIDATIAIEDDSFYGHIGFDIGGIIKATLNHLFGIGSQRGGSTITQQLVKNTFLSDIAYDRTISRKLKEILLSVKVELNYSKDEILELYLNNIPYGHNAHGIETASKTFFGKSARELTLAESAVLASLPVAPTRFSPYGTNKDLLMGWYETDLNTGEQIYKKGRKDLVLQRMLDLKKITFEEFKQAFSEAKEIEFKRYRSDIQAPHFVFYVRERLEEKYGKEFLKNGGLRIYTTLDPKLQQDAEEVIATKSAHYEDTYGAKNVALASINPENGEILAYVGGKDFFDTEHDGQVDVLTSRRQPGSSFKPFVYASAFEQGYTPSTVLFDTETDFGGNYQPQNFDGEFLGPVSMRESLNRSLNIPAVKTAFLARPENVLKLASRLGIKYEGNAEIHNVAVGIGVAEVEPLSHINAFQVFVGDGSWYEPTAILEVHNSDGTVLETFDPLRTRHEGLDPEIAALVRHVLTDESTRPTTEGFDWNNLLQLPEYNNGAKTGTSNRKTENPEFDENKPEDDEENPKFITTPGDSWTIGFTPHLVTGVWVGNNRGEPMKQGSTGLAVAAPIWKRFMLDAHEILVSAGADPEKLYHEPTPLEVRPVNKFTGRIATDLTPPRLVREEVFPSFAIPTELDDSVQTIEVDKVSGRPVTPFTPFYSRTRQYALTGLKSIRPDLPHWQEPVEEWLHTHPKFLTSLGTIMDEDPKETRNIFSRQTSRLSNLSDNPRNQFSQVNAPTIRITSPKNGGIVARGQVEITTSITAPQEMRAVEFYLNDQLVADATRSPWNGKFQIPSTTPEGEKQVIRAIAIDQLFNIGESEIEVTIAPDQKGPEITFLGPVGKQRIPLGTKMQILADVRDEESGVKLVEFFKDEQSLGFTESPPYERSFRAEGSLGTHEIKIKAWDLHGNVSEKTIPVLYERERLLQSGSPEISDIYSYRSSISVDAIFPEYENIEWVELVAEQKETILFSEKIELPPQSAQFQIPKNQGGKTTLRLITKFKGNNKLHESPIRKVDL